MNAAMFRRENRSVALSIGRNHKELVLTRSTVFRKQWDEEDNPALLGIT